MGTTPTTDDTLADFANTVVGIFITGDEVAAETYIAAQVPVLEGPVISLFTNEIITLIMNAVKTNITAISTALIIDQQTGDEESDVKVAFANLQAAKATGDANAIATATQAFLTAAAALAHSDGSSTNVNS